MKLNLKTAALLCGTGTLLLTGWKTVPLMQQTTIGTSPAAAIQTPELPAAPEPAQVPAETAPAADSAQPLSGTYTAPEVHAPAATAAKRENLIEIESDGSKAMWNTKLYRCPDTATGGKIVDRQYSNLNGNMFLSLAGGGQIRNCTSWNNSDLLAESKQQPDLDIRLDGTPMVLIYHTHTTESYVEKKTGTYDSAFTFRTTEPDKNMVAVGAAIADQLSAAGIGVIHAKEMHDYPVWNGAYGNSARTIQSILKQYPSVCVALDIHRDAISAGSTVYAPVCTINGKKSAQIMIISGCDKGNMGMPHYRDNFHFACRLQETAETMFPGFTRPILFDYRKYNQNLTKGSLLIEVGSQGNTLEEARYAGELVGQALTETLRHLAEQNTQEASST